MAGTNQANRGGRGKQKIEIKKVEKTSNRYVTFSKRKAGLFKKAAVLSSLSGADVGVLVISQAGKVYSFGNPGIDSVIDRYLHCSRSPEEVSTVECLERLNEKEAEKEEFWWEKLPEEMTLDELQSFKRSLEGLRKNVLDMAELSGERESMRYFENIDCGRDDQSFDSEIIRMLLE